MGAFKRLAVFAKAIVAIGLVMIEEKIEDFDSRESRADLHERIRKAAERGGELALRVADLEDEVDGLRFNGPTLYRDEVELLKEYATVLKTSLAFNNDAVESPEERERDYQIISSLLNRCDHAPYTAAELAAQVQGIADGTVETLPWDDVFKSNCRHSGWDFNYGSCPDCGQEGCGDATT